MIPLAVPITVIPLDVPITPSPDDARRLLTEELARTPYGGQTLLQQLFNDLWTRLNRGDVSWSTSNTIALLLGVGLIVALIWLVLRSRNDNSRRSTATSPLVDPTITPAAYRLMAEQAIAAGRFDEATVAAFRAIVSDLDRRSVLGDRPGRTAHEAATVMGQAFPHQEEGLRFGAEWFDLAAYGIDHGTGERTTATQAQTLLDLGTEISGTRPVFEPILGTPMTQGSGS